MSNETPSKFEISIEQLTVAIALINRCLGQNELLTRQKIIRLQVNLQKTLSLPEDLRTVSYEEQPYKTQSDVVIDDRLRRNLISLQEALNTLKHRSHLNIDPKLFANWIHYLTLTVSNNSIQDIDELRKIETRLGNIPDFAEA